MLRAKEVARIIHVSLEGDDAASGGEASPLRTINAAAQIAVSGDTVRVHAGTYRESIDPLNGGKSDAERVTYEAATDEDVIILGSEPVTGWSRVSSAGPNIWTATVSNEIFTEGNPFSKSIAGDWFYNKGRPHHTGSVYVGGIEYMEATTWKDLREFFWYAKVHDQETQIWISCGSLDPNIEKVEINVRSTIFYPTRTGVNFITVRGFKMRNAATNWAPPTSEQIGLIGTNWSKGWIIEDNVISHSRCVGVTLGKHGDQFDNCSEDTAEGYVSTIERALERGWSRDSIGGHVVRRNVISNCEQAGIVGSLGAIFSEVSNNVIHDIHMARLFEGAEQAGIKFHAPIDTIIKNNHIYRCNRAMWMDWMTQGTRITGNFCHDNLEHDLFLEVNHGPYIVDHNLFLSSVSIFTMSQGGAFVHNLIGGTMIRRSELGRETPYHSQSSVQLAGIDSIRGGDERYINNIFLDAGAYELACEQKFIPDGFHCKPLGKEALGAFSNVSIGNEVAKLSLSIKEDSGEWNLRVNSFGSCLNACAVMDTHSLGETQISHLPYRGTDGKPFTFDIDYFGIPRSDSTLAGPFHELSTEIEVYRVYPLNAKTEE